MGGNELTYINDAFHSNWIAPVGHNIGLFEEKLEQYLGGVQVTALSSGTAAIHLGLIMLGVGVGDEVIVQTHTHVASVNPVVYLGATPVFVDSERETWNICPLALEEAIKDRIAKGKKPKAIIAVHLYGMPYKVEEVHAVADKYEIPVLEDSAEALGSSYAGRKCGTFGKFGILSFNGNKIITTSGGGALVSQDRAAKDKALFLATQARDPAPHYQHSETGYNYRLSNICAGIGCGQMEVLEQHLAKRRNNHYFYADFFAGISGVTLLSEPDARFFSNYWLSAILIDPQLTDGKTREGLRLLLESQNIESRPLWKPMHLQPLFSRSPYYGANRADKLFEQGLCLPSGSNLGDSDLERIKLLLSKFFC